MPAITKLGRVLIPVSDQDAAIEFYRDKLGFSVAVDVPFGEGSRWVEISPPGGGATIALTPPQGEFQPPRMTGVGLETQDARASHSELRDKGVDVDQQLMGGEGGAPPLFFLRDLDGNTLLVAQTTSG